MAAGMAHLDYTGETQIECPATYVIPGTDVVVNDWVVEEGAAEQGVLTLHNALVQSCNTVFYQIGYDLDRQDEHAAAGYGQGLRPRRTDRHPLPSRIQRNRPRPQWKQDTIGDFWARGDAINLSIGQGFLLATPLQMANAYAAIANNGSLLQPFIVEFAQNPETGEQERIGERDGIRRLPIEREQRPGDPIRPARPDQQRRRCRLRPGLRRLRVAHRRQDRHSPDPARPPGPRPAALLVRRLRAIRRPVDDRLGCDDRVQGRGRPLCRPCHPRHL